MREIDKASVNTVLLLNKTSGRVDPSTSFSFEYHLDRQQTKENRNRASSNRRKDKTTDSRWVSSLSYLLKPLSSASPIEPQNGVISSMRVDPQIIVGQIPILRDLKTKNCRQILIQKCLAAGVLLDDSNIDRSVCLSLPGISAGNCVLSLDHGIYHLKIITNDLIARSTITAFSTELTQKFKKRLDKRIEISMQ